MDPRFRSCWMLWSIESTIRSWIVTTSLLTSLAELHCKQKESRLKIIGDLDEANLRWLNSFVFEWLPYWSSVSTLRLFRIGLRWLGWSLPEGSFHRWVNCSSLAHVGLDDGPFLKHFGRGSIEQVNWFHCKRWLSSPRQKRFADSLSTSLRSLWGRPLTSGSSGASCQLQRTRAQMPNKLTRNSTSNDACSRRLALPTLPSRLAPLPTFSPEMTCDHRSLFCGQPNFARIPLYQRMLQLSARFPIYERPRFAS